MISAKSMSEHSASAAQAPTIAGPDVPPQPVPAPPSDTLSAPLQVALQGAGGQLCEEDTEAVGSAAPDAVAEVDTEADAACGVCDSSLASEAARSKVGVCVSELERLGDRIAVPLRELVLEPACEPVRDRVGCCDDDKDGVGIRVLLELAV